MAALAPAACGKKAPPVAPERRAPAPVADLRASIDERAVVLTWTNPTRRADGSRLRDLAILRIHRRQEADGASAKPAMLRRDRVVGYDAVATVRLASPAPAEVEGAAVRWRDEGGLTVGRRYTYVVTAVDATDRSSPPSERVTLRYLASPASPQNVRAQAGDRSVTIAWEAPGTLIDGSALGGEVRYLVLRASGDAPPAPVTPEPIAGLEFHDGGLDNDTPYRYRVRAVRVEPEARAAGPASLPVEATPRDTTPPAPPTRLVAIPSPDAVRLSWSPSADADVALYVVYRAEGPGAGARIGSTPAATTVFVDREIRPGATYRYAVAAVDGARLPNESRPSDEVAVTLP